MQSSPISSTICNIRRKHVFQGLERSDENSPYPQFGCDICRRLRYLIAEVKSENLDQGEEPTQTTCKIAEIIGVPGDRPCQIVAKRLGGCGKPDNIFPLNSEISTSAWKADEDVVYEHVKQAGDRHARLEYAFEYDEEKTREMSRFFKIYYHFELFENGKVVRTTDGVFENTSPRLTNPYYYY